MSDVNLEPFSHFVTFCETYFHRLRGGTACRHDELRIMTVLTDCYPVILVLETYFFQNALTLRSRIWICGLWFHWIISRQMRSHRYASAIVWLRGLHLNRSAILTLDETQAQTGSLHHLALIPFISLKSKSISWKYPPIGYFVVGPDESPILP